MKVWKKVAAFGLAAALTAGLSFEGHQALTQIRQFFYGVNAADAGTQCDGVTNDAAALQNAVNSAVSLRTTLTLTGVVNSGDCVINSAINVTGPVKIVGMGKTQTRLRLGTTTQNGFNVTSGTSDLLNRTSAVVFSDFAIVAPTPFAAVASLDAGGSGYTNGTQTLTLAGGTCSIAPTFSVTVSGNIVTSVTNAFVNKGNCTVLPTNPVATTGGGGSGATLDVVWQGNQTAGAGILIDPGAGKSNNYSIITNLLLQGLWNGVDGERVGFCTFTLSDYDTITGVGLTVQNLTNQDTTGCLVDKNHFVNLTTPGATTQQHVVIEMALAQVSNNVFSGGLYQLDLAVPASTTEGELFVTSNSFENMTLVAGNSSAVIRLFTASGAVHGRIHIMNNEISPLSMATASTSYGLIVSCGGSPPGLSELTVVGNSFNTSQAFYAAAAGTVHMMDLSCVTNLNVIGNVMRNFDTTTTIGTTIGANVSSCTLFQSSQQGTFSADSIATAAGCRGVKQMIGLTDGTVGVTQNATTFETGIASASEANIQNVCPYGGVFRNLQVITTAPAAGQTLASTIRVNGVNSAVTCTVTGTGTTCSDTTHAATCTAGQSWSLGMVTSATTGTLHVSGGVEFGNP